MENINKNKEKITPIYSLADKVEYLSYLTDNEKKALIELKEKKYRKIPRGEINPLRLQGKRRL